MPSAQTLTGPLALVPSALLLGEGPAAVTHQRVAQQAGVGRATVYRHWPRSEQLLLDVMAGAGMPFLQQPETPVRPWLHRQLRMLADELAMPQVSAVALTLMQGAQWDPHIAAQRDSFLETLDVRLRAALALAVANGELDLAAGPPDLAAILVGPILYRTGMEAGAVSPELVDRLIGGLGTWRDAIC